MIKNRHTRKTIAIFFLIFSFVYKINAQGPNSPEATAFEPVDATDMVNLVTGDLSYVLPLLNIPSPEGGYPIALSYHAGIAIDQEASWVGLGWNINPGAINRTVNGYPDDWKTAHMREIFYDKGGAEDQYSVSVGYGVPGAWSVGVGVSWGSNRAFGGHVEGSLSIGVRGSVGTEGISMGVGSGPGTSVNISVGYNGDVGVGMGYTFMSGVGLNLGYGSNGLSGGASFDGGYSKNGETGKITNNSPGSSVGISFSSKSISVKGGAAGFGTGGFSYNFEQSANSGDYYTNESNKQIALVTPWFYISFGHRHYEWHLDKANYNTIDGVIYNKSSYPTYSVSEGPGSAKVYPKSYPWKNDNYELYTENTEDIDNEEFTTDFNNAYFPNSDNYSVNAQGLGGNISPETNENIGLVHNTFIKFVNRTDNIFVTDKTPNIQGNKINFHFKNEHSSFLRVLPSKIKNLSSTQNINNSSNYLNGPDNDDLINNLPENYHFTTNNDKIVYSLNGKTSYNESNNRLKKSSYIEYFTNKEIRDGVINGFMEAKGLERTAMNTFLDEGIGAYRITTADGKTYHYSLPVYQFEKIQRTFNIVAKPENEAHFDKIYRDSYATHWLLTAITGPDYVKKSPESINYPEASEAYSDYGYWVRFDYGKWTDGHLWKTPYGKEYEETTIGKKTYKSYTWGRKQLYYLDAIKTRTHTALFIKNIREDAQSRPINYQNMYHNRSSTLVKANVPSQKQLKLEKIIVLKNNKIQSLNKQNTISTISIPLTYSYEFLANTRYGNTTSYGIGNPAYTNFQVNQQQNVLDIGDISEDVYNNSSSIIEFNHDYGLASNAPYTSGGGKLTLNSVTTKGKGGEQLVPPYSFKYLKSINGVSNTLNIEDKDNWGYRKGAPMLWSLNEIDTPTGSTINIKYEEDKSISAVKPLVNFEIYGNDYKVSHNGNEDTFTVFYGENTTPYILSVGQKLVTKYVFINEFGGVFHSYDGLSTVESDLGNNRYLCKFDGSITSLYGNFNSIGTHSLSAETVIHSENEGGGIRVSEIIVNNLSKTTYHYSNGITSFIPGDIDVAKKTPYLSELPAAYVFYGNVSVKNKDNINTLVNKVDYKFKTLKVKEDDKIKFDDIFELEEEIEIYTNSTNNIPVKTKKLVIKDGKNTLGRLISREVYNSKNQLLSKKVNNYKEFSDFEQGVYQESYYSAKEVEGHGTNSNLSKWAVNTSTRMSYPSVLESVKETAGGMTSITYFDKYDFLTGQVLETRSYVSDGKAFKTKTVPAYTKYPEMGSKVDDISNKNMLTQEAANYSYIFKDNDWKPVGVGITTWNNEWYYQLNNNAITTGPNTNVWRKHKSYVWKGAKNEDGTLNFTDDFAWAVDATQTSNWQKTSETTRYNQFSNPLEIKDINNNYASSKMGDDYSKVIATANANYNEMYYSGAEYLASEDATYFDGGIKSFGHKSVTDAHTGTHVVEINTGQNAFEVKVLSRPDRTGIKQRFKVSVWVRKGDENKAKIKVNGATPIDFNTEESVPAGDWILLNGYVTIPTTETIIAVTSNNGLIQLDDFRLHPAISSMTTYVYNEWDEVSFITGANGLSAHYKYDKAGRLIETQVETVTNTNAGIEGGFERVSTNSYNYKKNQ